MKKLLKNIKQQLISYQKGSNSNIFLFAARRGGSTLLAEFIASKKGIWFANEPFACFPAHSQYEERIKHLPLLPDSQFFDLTSSQKIQVEKYINTLLVAGYPSLGSCKKPKLPLTVDRVLLKILNAPFLINWLSEIENSQTLLLSRHPAAQSLSVLRNQWKMSAYTYFEKPQFLSKYLTPEKIKFGQLILAEGTEWEKAILNWIIETYIPFSLSHDRVLHVSYEELVLHSEKTFELVCKYLNLENTNPNSFKLEKPSSSSRMSTSSTIKSIESGDYSSLVSKWQTQVNQQQKDSAQKILDTFEVDLYSMSEPMLANKYSILNKSLV